MPLGSLLISRAGRCGRDLQAFTLIEMLLVVAIISLLIAIVLPALNQSKQWAHTDRCAANERLLLVGYQAYFQENNKQLMGSNTGDWFDWLGDGNTTTSITSGKLWNYVRVMDAYRCPNHVYPWYLNAYSINGMLNGEQVFDGSNSKLHWTRNMINDKQLVFLEEDDNRGWNINSWMLGGTDSFIDLPAANHLQGDNLGFMDGHVEYWRWLDSDMWIRPKHNPTPTFGFSDPGNLDYPKLVPVFRSWPRN